MSNRIDPKYLSLTPGIALEPKRESKPSSTRRKRFLKGPIPLEWLCRAASLPGKAFAVAVAVRYRAGVCREKEVTLGKGVQERFGISRATVYRGLSRLEFAGLVAVDRKRGRLARITILEVDDET